MYRNYGLIWCAIWFVACGTEPESFSPSMGDWSRDSLSARQWESRAQVWADSAKLDSAAFALTQAREIWATYDRPWDLARIQLQEMGLDQDPAASIDQIDAMRVLLGQAPRYRGDSLLLIEACINMAQAFRRDGEMDSAAFYLSRGQMYLPLHNDSTRQHHAIVLAMSWVALHESSGDATAMEPYFEQLKGYRWAPYPIARSNQIEMNLVFAVYFLNNSILDSAAHYVRESEALARQTYAAHHPTLGMILSWMAYLHNIKGEYAEGLANNLELIEITRSLVGDSHPSLGQDYNNLGVSYDYLGLEEKSLAAYKKALAIFAPDTHIQVYHANTYQNVGAAYDRLGLNDSALFYYRIALEKWKALGGEASYPYRLANLYSSFGNIRYYQRDYEAALAMMQRAQSMYEDLLPAEHFIFGELANNFAQIYGKMGDSAQSLHWARKSISLVQRNVGATHPSLVNSFEQIAALLEQQGAIDSAQMYFRRGADIIANSYAPAHPQRIKGLYLHSQFQARQGDSLQAQQLLDEALTQVNLRGTLDQQFQKARIFHTQGEWALAQDKWAEALSFFQQSLHHNLADFAPVDLYQNPDSFSFRTAKALLGSLGGKALALQGWADQQQDRGLYDRALDTYATLIEAEQVIRQQDVSSDTKALFSGSASRYYSAALEMIYTWRSGQPDTTWAAWALRFMEANKSRDLQEFLQDRRAQKFANLPEEWLTRETRIRTRIDYFKRKIRREEQAGEQADREQLDEWLQRLAQTQAEWARYYRAVESTFPDYFHLRYAIQKTTLADLQASLRPGEVWLEYFWGEKNLFGLGISQTGCQMLRLPLEGLKPKLRALIPRLYDENEALNFQNDSSHIQAFVRDSYALYHQLVAPLLPPAAVKALRIVPDGPLSYLPFSVLLTQPQPDTLHYVALPYVMRSSSVQYALSASLARQNKEAAPRKIKLAGFAPTYGRQDTAATEGNQAETMPVLADLPHSKAEIQAALEIIGGDEFIGADAREAHFKAAAKHYDILHLAMHGFASDSDPLGSWLAFSPNRDRSAAEDGRLFAYEIFRLPLKAQLTVLSACHTGIGAQLEGEGQISLARAFAYAGCPSLVMTLWAAEDAAARGLMQHFYAELAQGKEKDVALRNAKWRFLRTSGSSHPFYWAHFVSLGDPAPVIAPQKWWHF